MNYRNALKTLNLDNLDDLVQSQISSSKHLNYLIQKVIYLWKMEQSICRRNKYGYCKHGDKCHFKHEKQICTQSNCTVFSCQFRHPRICKWFEEYGMCKFSSFCKFRHEKFESIENLVLKIKENEVKLNDVNKKLENIEKEERNKMKTIEEYEVQAQKRFQELEKKISTFVKLLEERLFDFRKKKS